jgi:hypothetical protein
LKSGDEQEILEIVQAIREKVQSIIGYSQDQEFNTNALQLLACEEVKTSNINTNNETLIHRILLLWKRLFPLLSLVMLSTLLSPCKEMRYRPKRILMGSSKS